MKKVLFLMPLLLTACFTTKGPSKEEMALSQLSLASKNLEAIANTSSNEKTSLTDKLVSCEKKLSVLENETSRSQELNKAENEKLQAEVLSLKSLICQDKNRCDEAGNLLPTKAEVIDLKSPAGE